MKMTKIKTCLAIFAALVLLLCSGESLASAQSAVYGFWKNFLPAMLPFFLLSPYLTGPEAQNLFARLFGKAFGALFGVSGKAAGAVVCGWIAGSPAGCSACARAGGDMEAAEYARMCALASGLSPAFLITAVGSGMLGETDLGLLLYIAHFAALLTGGLLLRKWRPGWERGECAADRKDGDIFAGALLALGRVLCWMTLFSVGSSLLCARLGGLLPAWLIAPVCEISGGAAVLAGAQLPETAKMALLGALSGFGGLCVLMQNAQAGGVPVRVLVLPKILHALLTAGFASALCRAKLPARISLSGDVLGASCVCALALVALTALLCHAGAKNRVDVGLSRAYTDTKAQ